MLTELDGAIAAFREAVAAPGVVVGRWRAGNPDGKVIGYFTSYFPVEIVRAAGGLPVRLWDGQGLESQSMQSFACPVGRSVLGMAEQGQLDYLDGVAFPRACDTLLRVHDSWSQAAPKHWVSSLASPAIVNTLLAEDFLRAELVDWAGKFAAFGGIAIEEDSLWEAWAQEQEKARLLRAIWQKQRSSPPPLRGKKMHCLVLAGVILPLREYLALLRTVQLALNIETPPKAREEVKRAARVLLSGSLLADPELLAMIETCGADVVAEDTSTGYRSYAVEVEPGVGDPWRAVARRLLGQVPCSFKYDAETRLKWMLNVVTEYQLDGVIFVLEKYCEPEAFESPYLRQQLAGAGIPSLCIERERGMALHGRSRTRIEAFIESLAGRGGSNNGTAQEHVQLEANYRYLL